jgi:hypothetical protein
MSAAPCLGTGVLKISPSIALSLSAVSFIGILCVFLSMFWRTNKRHFRNEKEMFSHLAQSAITFLFLNDLCAQLFYMPSQVLNIVFNSYEHLNKNSLSLLWIGSQVSEGFVIASGFWNLIIILCIYWSLTGTQTDVDDLDDKELKYRVGFIAFAWGIPITFAVVMTVINMRFQVWTLTSGEFFFGSLISDCIHSGIYFMIEVVVVIVTIRVFLFIRNVPTFDSEAQRKKRFILIKLLLYTIPFVIVATILSIRRSVIDIERLRAVIEGDSYSINFCMSLAGLILTQIHFVTYPLRGAMNAFVYFVLSDSVIGFLRTYCSKYCCAGLSNRLSWKIDDE